MVKELSWEDQELFLRRQLEASIEAIRGKVAISYPNCPFLTDWEPEILKKSLKSWVFALSGEQNYLLGIDDFSITMTIFELGKPIQLIAYTPNSRTETRIIDNKNFIVNGYRLTSNRSSNSPKINRSSGNELNDRVFEFRQITDNTPENKTSLVNIILNRLLVN